MKDILITLNKFQTSNIKLQTMTSIITERLQEQYDSSNKSYKGKIISGDKMRRTDDYWLKTRNSERRKQTKVRHDTHRRDEQPTEEDIRLEDIHFANFLGSKSEDGIPYNNVHIDEPVNIVECDIYLKPEPVPEEAAPQEEGDYINTEEYLLQRQIEREENTAAHLDLVYIPETKTLTSNGWYFKRLHEENELEEQPEAKRARSEDNLAAMVEYMRQQVELAQQIVADELYVCDCEHK
jgi:hypothetical protein